MKIWENPGKDSGFIIPTMEDKLDIPLRMHLWTIHQRQLLKVFLKLHLQFKCSLAPGTEIITGWARVDQHT